MTTQGTADLQQQQQRAHHVFTEMLTSVQPEVKHALVALYDLVRIEQQICRCQCREA